MAKVICRKCSTIGHSKCPHCRSIFDDSPPGEDITLIEYILTTEFGERLCYGASQKALTVHYFIRPEWSEVEAFTHMASLMNRLVEMDKVKEFLCRHEWEFAPGETSEIDCGHS